MRSLGHDSTLGYLMSAYFHQDFHLENGDSNAVVAAFCRDDSHLVLELAGEITLVLGSDPSESELSSLSLELGCWYAADSDFGTYRAWFESIEAQARAHAAEHPAP